jgi:hypothetical protein
LSNRETVSSVIFGMTKMLGLFAAALGVFCATASTEPLFAKSETVTPSSGPVGALVTISGLDSCEDGTAMFNSESTPGGRYTTSGEVTLTVPASTPVGPTSIWLTCKNGGFVSVGGVWFEVTESTAIRGQPNLTG